MLTFRGTGLQRNSIPASAFQSIFRHRGGHQNSIVTQVLPSFFWPSSDSQPVCNRGQLD